MGAPPAEVSEAVYFTIPSAIRGWHCHSSREALFSCLPFSRNESALSVRYSSAMKMFTHVLSTLPGFDVLRLTIHLWFSPQPLISMTSDVMEIKRYFLVDRNHDEDRNWYAALRSLSVG